MKAAKEALKAGKEALEMEKAALFQTVVAKTVVPSGVDPKSVLCEFYKAGKVRRAGAHCVPKETAIALLAPLCWLHRGAQCSESSSVFLPVRLCRAVRARQQVQVQPRHGAGEERAQDFAVRGSARRQGGRHDRPVGHGKAGQGRRQQDQGKAAAH